MTDHTTVANRTNEFPVPGRKYPEEDPQNRLYTDILHPLLREINAHTTVTGPQSDLSNAEPEDGALYVPTDGGAWHLGDGTSWSEVYNPADFLSSSGGIVTGDVEINGGTLRLPAANADHRFEPAGDGSPGLVLRAMSDPAAGGEIFQVRSAGGTVRFSVDHAGETYVSDDFRVAGSTTFSGDLDISGGTIINPQEISITDTYAKIGLEDPTAKFTIRDETNSQDRLAITDGLIEAVGDLTVTGTATVGGDLDVKGFKFLGDRGLVSDTQFAALETYGTGDGSWEVFDKANSQPIFYANEGGSVEVPNGSLDVAGRTTSGELELANTARIFYDTGKTGDDFHIQRAKTGADTALTISGTNVGINNTAPAVPLDVGGDASVAGALDVSSNVTTGGTIYPPAESSGIAWDLDSSTTTLDWAKIQFNDAAGDSVYWTSNRDSLHAFKVTNSTQATDLLITHDSGDVDVTGAITSGGDPVPTSSSGQYDIQKNGSDATGVINFKT